MRAIAAFLIVLMACHGPRGPFVTGAALYAHAAELDRDGSATVTTTDQAMLDIRRTQWLVTRERDQVFVVEQVVKSCRGGDPTTESDCTLALLMDKQFTVQDTEPMRSASPGEWKHAGKLKALVATTLVGAAFTFGAVSCDFSDDCKELFTAATVITGVVWLLIALSFIPS